MFRLILAAVFCTLSVVSAAESGRKIALVIGNSSYQFISELNNPYNDASAVASELERIGFETHAYYDLDKSSLKKAIILFNKEVKADDIVFIYYAGHGIELFGKNYLIPTDAYASSVKEVQKNCIPISALTYNLTKSENGANILVLDACRNNPFTLINDGSIHDGLAIMDAPPQTIISFSTAPGKVALDGTDNNSPFTASLLKYLILYDLDVNEIFEKVRADVIDQTSNQQVPWESTSLTKEVILRRKPELKLNVSILEGDTANFKGKGSLNAQTNLNNVSYAWYNNNQKLGNSASLDVYKSGDYLVKVISLEGQIQVAKSHVKIKSLVKPNVHIAEGERVVFVNSGILHARSNVMGNCFWSKDAINIGTGHTLKVTESGNYNLTIVTSDGRKITSTSTKVIIK